MILRERKIFLFATLSLLFFSCSNAPSLKIDSGFSNNLFKEACAKRIYGYGDLEVSIDGRRYSGSIDIDWTDEFFRANVYSPLGNLITSINSNCSLAVLSSKDGDLKFNTDTIPEMFPFVLVKGLGFNDFVTVLTGRLPGGYNKFDNVPDTVYHEKKSTVLVWMSDSVESVAYMSKKNHLISKIVIKNRKNSRWKLNFNKINQMLASSIHLMVDDRNYFSIIYEKLKME